MQPVPTPVVGYRHDGDERYAELASQEFAAIADAEAGLSGPFTYWAHDHIGNGTVHERCSTSAGTGADRIRVLATPASLGASRRRALLGQPPEASDEFVRLAPSSECRWSRNVPVDRLIIRSLASLTVASA
jgi:hypothetical protein